METDIIDIKDFRKSLGISSDAHASLDRRKWTTKPKTSSIKMPGGIDRLVNIRELRYIQKLSLQEIGKIHKISRERVRQILKDKDGREIQRQKTEQRKRDAARVCDRPDLTNAELQKELGMSLAQVSVARAGRRHKIEPKSMVGVGAKAEEMISKLLTENGIPNQLMAHHHQFDILLENGLKIDVKSRTTPFAPPSFKKPLKSKYWVFHTAQKRKGVYADFFIVVIIPLNAVFVIPAKEAKNTILITWPKIKKTSKFAKYHNAFDLLKIAP